MGAVVTKSGHSNGCETQQQDKTIGREKYHRYHVRSPGDDKDEDCETRKRTASGNLNRLESCKVDEQTMEDKNGVYDVLEVSDHEKRADRQRRQSTENTSPVAAVAKGLIR